MLINLSTQLYSSEDFESDSDLKCQKAKEVNVQSSSASDKADRNIRNMLQNAKFKEENVHKILVDFAYLTAKELRIELNMQKKGMRLVSEASFSQDKDEEEAVTRKTNQEVAGNIDLRPFISRMIAHANLNQKQTIKIEQFQKLSLEEIENKLKEDNLSLEEVENKLKTEVHEDLAREDHLFYIKICKEIYKSKKRAEITKIYKDCSAQEMCEQINKLGKVGPIVFEIYDHVLSEKICVDDFIFFSIINLRI